MPKIKVAILGCRGIPNCYGGFEELAQQLSERLVSTGFNVTVYNSHKHPYQQKEWNGVQIVHRYDPENVLGTAGQFIYDYNCIRHAKRNGFDALLFLGYTSSSVFGKLYPKNTSIISNMDGLEWKRTKYSKPVQRFLRYAEKLAVKYSDHLIADSVVIQTYLEEKYVAESTFIPYGANVTAHAKNDLLKAFNIAAGNYYMLMARMEPENNIEMILDGFHESNTPKKMLVAGNTTNSFGKAMVQKYKTDERICFSQGIYNAEFTHALRQHCALYFHGHSVGGTNPSLLEAMADKALVAAHNNGFNKAVLQDDALYFTCAKEIKQLIEEHQPAETIAAMIENNFKKIISQYNWENITNRYAALILKSCNAKKP